MDLANEILKFSSTLQQQDENPLRDGLKFLIIDESLSPPAYNDYDSTTTVEGLGVADTYGSNSKRDFNDNMNPGTPSSQATASNNVLVEGWPAQQRELGLEIERLSMWKYDVRDQGIDIKFEDENNPLHTIIRRCLVNIAHVLIGLLSPDFKATRSELGDAHEVLRQKTEAYRMSIQPRHVDEDGRPYAQTRSRQSSFGASTDDIDVLGNLRDNIDRLGYLLSGLLVSNSAATSLGKRLRSKGSLEGDEGQVDRKKLYNGPQSLSQIPEELEEDLLALERSIADMESLWDSTASLVDRQTHHAASSRGLSTTLTLSDQFGQVSALVDLAVGPDSSISCLKSASRAALEGLSVITTPKDGLKDKPFRKSQTDICNHSAESMKRFETLIRVGEVLSGLPRWRIHTNAGLSGFLDPVVTATWLLLLEELLVSLRYILRHPVKTATTALLPNPDQLAQLQGAIKQYSECQTRSRLERLIATRRSTSSALKRIHQSVSDAIRSLCGHQEQSIDPPARSALGQDHARATTTDFEDGKPEQESLQTTIVEASGVSLLPIFTICMTEDATDQSLCRKSLDDYMAPPLL